MGKENKKEEPLKSSTTLFEEVIKAAVKGTHKPNKKKKRKVKK